MSETCPEEAARTATASDRSELDRLRNESRETVREQRGGAALIGRDRPRARTDPVVAAALDGADDAVVIVGTLDEMIVGYMLAEADHFEESGRVLTLLELWVTPQARKLGVGEAMMGELVGWGRSIDCLEMDATALPGDRDTKNFFEIHGLVARQIEVSRRLD